MANRNKRFRGCKPNPIIETMSFGDYVEGFCKDQENQRTLLCSVCGSDSVCTSAHRTDHCVHGVFKCPNCNHEDYKWVNVVQLKAMFDRMRLQHMDRV